MAGKGDNARVAAGLVHDHIARGIAWANQELLLPSVGQGVPLIREVCALVFGTLGSLSITS